MGIAIWDLLKHIKYLLLILFPVLFVSCIPLCVKKVTPDRADRLFRALPLTIAHRGGSPTHPENTIPAILEGLNFGADGVEIDVMLCKSGEIVVFHDYEVDGLTNGTGRVKKLTLDQLKALQFDYRPGIDPRTRIPTLPEVIDSIHTHLQNGRVLDIELKGEKLGTDGLEKKAVDLVRSRGILKSVVFSSYNPLMVKRVERIDPSLLTGILISDGVPAVIRWSRYTRWCGADFIAVQSRFVDKKYLERWQDYRVLSFIENIEDVNAEHLRLIDLNIDGIITDSVTFLMDELD